MINVRQQVPTQQAIDLHPKLDEAALRQPEFQRMGKVAKGLEAVNRFFAESTWAQQTEPSNGSDFVLGNPPEPLPEFVAPLRHAIEPQNNNWYPYKRNKAIPACNHRQQLAPAAQGTPYVAEDIFLANGAFAAISVTLKVVCDPGDEVIFISPPWFFYESLIMDVGATAVRVRIDPREL